MKHWTLQFCSNMIAFFFVTACSASSKTKPQLEASQNETKTSYTTTQTNHSSSPNPSDSNDELKGGITSGGYIFDETTDDLNDIGIFYGKIDDRLVIANQSNRKIKVVSPKKTIAPKETLVLNLDDSSLPDSLELVTENNNFLGTIDPTNLPPLGKAK